MNKFLPQDRRARAAIFATAAVVVTLVLTQFVFAGRGSGQGTPAAILFQGLASGLVLALPACGIVLLFRSLRIVNFAQTAIGIGGAILVYEFIQFTSVPFPLALVLGIALAALIGVTFGVVTLRFFRSSRLVLTVFTIMAAKLLGSLSGLVRNLPMFPSAIERSTSDAVLQSQVDKLLPFEGFTFGVGKLGIRFGFAEIFSIEMAIISLVALGFFLRYTRSGVAIRALSENAERASLLGIGVGKLSILVWGIAGALSGIGIFANGSITTVGNATTFSIPVLVTVFAAAVIGGLVNLPRTIFAAVLLGVLERSFAYSYQNNTDLYNVGLFLIVAVSLLVLAGRRRRSESGEGLSFSATEEPRPVPKELAGVPIVRWSRLSLIGLGVLILVVYPFVVSTGAQVLAGVVALNTIAVLSLVILTGWAGQVSLGQYAFVTIGAVIGGGLSGKLGIPGGFFLSVPLATLLTAGIATVVGIPALRIRGLYLLVATVAFALAVQTNIFNADYFGWILPESVVRPEVFFLNFEDERSMYFLCVAALALAIVVLTNLRKSRVGRVLIAARENEPGIQSFGIGLFRTKLTAFAISGGMAGFAGAVLAHHQRGVSSDTFPLIANVDTFVQAIFGGVGSPAGALLGSAFFRVAQDLIGSTVILGLLTGGLPLMLLFVAPGGLISLINQARDSMLRIVAQRRQIVVPSLFADYDPEALEHQLIPLGEAQSGQGLAALAVDERWQLESGMYAGKGVRVRDLGRASKETADSAALSGAAKAVVELEEAS
ncbi:MAG TPA: ABC transporter permease [Acidimicrobiales bacterium]|nr:ABC transporter permease [Acidimicrobiales bacterium]